MTRVHETHSVPVDIVESTTRLLVCGCRDFTVATELAIELADAKSNAARHPLLLALLLSVRSFEIKLQVDKH